MSMAAVKERCVARILYKKMQVNVYKTLYFFVQLQHEVFFTKVMLFCSNHIREEAVAAL